MWPVVDKPQDLHQRRGEWFASLNPPPDIFQHEIKDTGRPSAPVAHENCRAPLDIGTSPRGFLPRFAKFSARRKETLDKPTQKITGLAAAQG